MGEEKKVVGRPFQKGVSGNPAGRPKRETERAYLEILKSVCTPARWQKICEVAVVHAEDGDKDARKWVSDNLIGVPVQRTELTGIEGGPVVIKEIVVERSSPREAS